MNLENFEDDVKRARHIHYGGPFVMAPAARLDEPALDCCLFGRAGTTSLLRYALGIVSGTHTRLRDVHYLKAEEIEVRNVNGGNPPVQADGDLIGTVPLRLSVARDALDLVLPTGGLP